jgi:hypothetical protein
MRPLLLPSLLLLPQALHEALLAVGDVFDDCAKYGIVRSLINAGKQQEVRLSGVPAGMSLKCVVINKLRCAELLATAATAAAAAAAAADDDDDDLMLVLR